MSTCHDARAFLSATLDGEADPDAAPEGDAAISPGAPRVRDGWTRQRA
jgi:hypothetical protein